MLWKLTILFLLRFCYLCSLHIDIQIFKLHSKFLTDVKSFLQGTFIYINKCKIWIVFQLFKWFLVIRNMVLYLLDSYWLHQGPRFHKTKTSVFTAAVILRNRKIVSGNRFSAFVLDWPKFLGTKILTRCLCLLSRGCCSLICSSIWYFAWPYSFPY